MSAVLWTFYDVDFLCKTEKSVGRINVSSTLESKAVGMPAADAPSSSSTPGSFQPFPPTNQPGFAPFVPRPRNFKGAAKGCCKGYVGEGGPVSQGLLPSSGSGLAPFPYGGGRRHLRLQRASIRSQVGLARYKTELCRPFEESGNCKYGQKCQFAHGFRELRILSRHPKYKTELCRTFHSIGFCPYGLRCHFIHNRDEKRLAPSESTSEGLRPFNPCEIPLLSRRRGQRLHLNSSHSLSGLVSRRRQARGSLGVPLQLSSQVSGTGQPLQPSCTGVSEASSTPTCCAAAAAAALFYSGGGALGATCPAEASYRANNALTLGQGLSSILSPMPCQTHNFAAYYGSRQLEFSASQGFPAPLAAPNTLSATLTLAAPLPPPVPLPIAASTTVDTDTDADTDTDTDLNSDIYMDTDANTSDADTDDTDANTDAFDTASATPLVQSSPFNFEQLCLLPESPDFFDMLSAPLDSLLGWDNFLSYSSSTDTSSFNSSRRLPIFSSFSNEAKGLQ